MPRATWYELQSDLQIAAPCAGLGVVLKRPSYKPRPAVTTPSLGPIKESYRSCQGQMLLVWEILERSEAWDKFIWKCHWKQLVWSWKLGGVASQGITRTGQTMIARLMGTQIWCLTVSSMWCGLRKRTMASANTFVWENAASPALTWCQIIEFLLVCSWCLLSCCPSAGVQREWVHVKFVYRPFQGNSWDSRSPPSH